MVEDPITQTCPACGALIDITEEEPFAMVHCPACGKGMRVSRDFDHFQLEELLGGGGMGTVYRALDKHLNRHVALKLLRREYCVKPEFVEQFKKEAAITASINHPHVVRVYSTGIDHGLLYITMELVDKGSLDDLMTVQGRIAEVQVLEVGVQIASGLNAALQQGLIHRDIKPGNILFANAHSAKIVDFGLAVLQEEAGKLGGEVWGTPYYVAPEKLDNQPEDFRSDMYSLAGTLFHALAGRPPFEAETVSMVALKRVKSLPVSIQSFAPDISSPTAYVINRALSKDPDQRYSSYEEFIEHLQYARDELKKTEGTKRTRARVVVGGAAEEQAMSWITLAFFLIVVLLGVGLFLTRDRWLFKSEDVAAPQSSPVAERPMKPGEAIDAKYQEARKEIVDGKYQIAANQLHELGGRQNVPQPLLNWINLHEGLAELLSDREHEARPVFALIQNRGPYSTDPTEANIAQFFVDMSEALAGDSATPAVGAKDLDRTNYQGLGLLLLGLKNWQLGDYESGVALLRQYQSTTPQAPNEWVAEYKPLIEPLINDWTQFRRITELAERTDRAETGKANLEEAKKARAQMKLAGALQTKADDAIDRLGEKVTAMEEKAAQEKAGTEAIDAKLLGEIKPKYDAFCAQMRYSEALAVAKPAKFNSEKGQKEYTALVKKAEWLTKFKNTLIQDLSNPGYPSSVAKRLGGAMPGTVRGASDQQIYVVTPYGSVPIPWSDVAPESVIAMGQYFIKPTLPADTAGDRQWWLGVYAYQVGKKREGYALLTNATQRKPEYIDLLPLFLAPGVSSVGPASDSGQTQP